VYGNAEVGRILRERYPEWPIEFQETCSFHPFRHAGYRITPIHANHKQDEDSQNLIIEHGGRTLLYATDTGIWSEQTWDFLRDVKLDLFVIECTEGFHGTHYWGHLDIPECIEVVDRLRAMGTLSSTTRVVTTHHGVQGNATHTQLEEALLPHGIEPGFDGMVLEIP
jgi:phosphoribosyl 1,2-cyclic phosphate phosphodiesterase